LRPANALPARLDAAKTLADFRRQAATLALDQTAVALIREAERRDIPWSVLERPRRIVELGYGHRLRRIRETVTSGTPAIATWLQNDKSATARLLSRMHLPAPRQGVATNPEAAVRLARQIGFPVVVKPLNTSKGRGISLHLSDDNAVRAAFALARQFAQEVIVESFIIGKDYRVLVVGGHIVAAANRIPAAVIGDGTRSVSQLVAEVNRDPERGVGFSRLMNRIEIDGRANDLLQRRGYTLDSVPPAGEIIYLRDTANISTGGTAVDVTDDIHPENCWMLERVARVIGLDVAGIDFITPDISKSYREVGGAICEVNSSPGLRPHQVAARKPGAKVRDVAGPIVDMLFPGGSNGRIPIAAITGTNGKTTTSRMVAHILRQAGGEIGVCAIGLATTEGVTIDGKIVAKGDFAGITGARVLLGDPLVEAAVLETARGGIVKSGLAFDWCDVGAVLNVTADHLDLDGIGGLDEMATLKGRVVEVARRLAVLNADDPRCLELAALKRPEQVCLFTLGPPETLQPHLDRGSSGLALAQRDGTETICLYRGGAAKPLMATTAMPATLGGAARHNIQNAMAAAGLALGLGISPDGIARALAAFKSDHCDNPGRLNIYEGHPFRVVLDFAHNPDGVQVVCKALRPMPVPGRRICVTTGIGNRHGEHIDEIAGIIADQFDVFVCSRLRKVSEERTAQRGFPPAEIPLRLARALRERGVAAENVLVVDLDRAAVDSGLRLAKEGDLLVFLTGIAEWVWDQIVAFGK
jgi:cyanophycin synthetase